MGFESGLTLSCPNHDRGVGYIEAYQPQLFVVVADAQKPEGSGFGGGMSSVSGSMCDTQEAERTEEYGGEWSPWLSCYPAPETYVSVPRSGRRVVEARLNAGLGSGGDEQLRSYRCSVG